LTFGPLSLPSYTLISRGVYGGHSLSDIATVDDGRSSIRSRVHYTKMSSTWERRRSDPTTTVGILPLWYFASIWWTFPHKYFDCHWWPLPLRLSCITKVYHEKKERNRPPRQQPASFLPSRTDSKSLKEHRQTESQPVTYMEQWHKKWPMFCRNVD
jgi:hypothetical protein